MARIKDEAEAFAIALESEATDVGTVVAWADKQIEKLEQPDWSLCEVALSGKKSSTDVIHLLQKIPGTPDQRGVMRGVLKLFKKNSNPIRPMQVKLH
jgi:hypothetical protein